MPQRQPPPDYLSRRFQMKMLSLLATLGLVIFLMSIARNPKNWEWFVRLGEPAGNTWHVDTRVQATPPSASETAVVSKSEAQLPKDATAEELAWWQVLEMLNEETRRRFLRSITDAAGGRAVSLDPAFRERLFSDLDRSWSAVLAGPMPHENDLEARWEQWRSLIAQAFAGKPVTDETRNNLGELDALLGRTLCHHIRDNTPHRRLELPAWERLLVKLYYADDERLAEQSVGRVSFLQLFDQGRAYRCRVVLIEGFVRRLERVPTQLDLPGIEALYRLWLKPADGTDAPIVVYCLDLPKGLPRPTRQQPVISREPPGDPVTLHAYFFKNWLYQGTDRTAYLAPLLLAKVPTYEPPPVAEATRGRRDPWLTLTLSALVAAIVALGVTWYAWRQRPANDIPPSLARLQQRRAASGEEKPDEVPDFDSIELE